MDRVPEDSRNELVEYRNRSCQSNLLFDVSKDEELREAFNWKNTQPLLKHDHQKKGTKFNFLDYQLQLIRAYQFIKLNEKGPNEEFH